MDTRTPERKRKDEKIIRKFQYNHDPRVIARRKALSDMTKRRRLEEELFCFRCGKEIAKCQCEDVALTQKEELRRLKLKIIELEKKVYKLEGYYEDMTTLKGDFAEIIEKTEPKKVQNDLIKEKKEDPGFSGLRYPDGW